MESSEEVRDFSHIPENEIATQEWAERLKERNPALTGGIGRPPTRQEIRRWDRQSKKKKQRLIAKKLRYMSEPTKTNMISYLKLRQSCGYVEGVPVPKWLMQADKQLKKAEEKEPLEDGPLEV